MFISGKSELILKFCLFFQSPDMAAWQNDYLQGEHHQHQILNHLIFNSILGTGCEMYTETLSPSFAGMSFSQAAEYENVILPSNSFNFFFCCRLCFIKLKLLLLAIEVKNDEGGGDPKICINPHMAKIPANSIGFFITQSAEEAKRLTI